MCIITIKKKQITTIRSSHLFGGFPDRATFFLFRKTEPTSHNAWRWFSLWFVTWKMDEIQYIYICFSDFFASKRSRQPLLFCKQRDARCLCVKCLQHFRLKPLLAALWRLECFGFFKRMQEKDVITLWGGGAGGGPWKCPWGFTAASKHQGICFSDFFASKRSRQPLLFCKQRDARCLCVKCLQHFRLKPLLAALWRLECFGFFKRMQEKDVITLSNPTNWWWGGEVEAEDNAHFVIPSTLCGRCSIKQPVVFWHASSWWSPTYQRQPKLKCHAKELSLLPLLPLLWVSQKVRQIWPNNLVGK